MGSPALERASTEAVSRLSPGSLPYVVGRAGLHSSAGRPVWPVMDESELEALRSTVALFDGAQELVDAKTAELRSVQDKWIFCADEKEALRLQGRALALWEFVKIPEMARKELPVVKGQIEALLQGTPPS